MSTDREMTLDEWCARLPEHHLANRELSNLKQTNEKVIASLEHALERLNAIPHIYDRTNFKLIEETLQQEYERQNIPNDKRIRYLRTV